MAGYSEGLNEEVYFENRASLGKYLQLLFLYLFFLTFTFVPTSYNTIRLGVLICLLILSVALNRGIIRYDKKALTILIFYISYSVFSAILGLLNNGSVDALKTNVFYPVVFFIIFLTVLDSVRIETITRILLACSFVVCAADLWIAFYSLGLINIYPSILYNIDLDYVFNKGFGTYFQYTSTHMVSHFFLAPFILFFSINSLKGKKDRIKLLALLLMEMLCIYFSGRAALILTCCASVILLFVYGKLKTIYSFIVKLFSNSHRIRIFLLVLLAFVILIYMLNSGTLNIKGIAEYVYGKIQGVYSDGNNVIDTRASQRIEYLSGWLESPLFGHGMGTGVPYLRDGIWVDDKAIELTYVSILYQYGLGGLMLLLSIVIYTFREILSKIKNGILDVKEGLPYLFGLFGILLGSEADPYLFTMGCIWMLYLPFSIAAFDRAKTTRIVLFWKR